MSYQCKRCLVIIADEVDLHPCGFFNRHNKIVIDNFLTAVDERFQTLVFQRGGPLAECYVDAKREIYDERYKK